MAFGSIFKKVGGFAKRVVKTAVKHIKDPVGTIKKDLKRAEYDLLERPKKDFKKHGATALGAIGGFLTGGPAGAVMGAGMGAQYGSQRRHMKKAERASKEAYDEEQRMMNQANAIEAEQARRQQEEADRLQGIDAERIRSRRKRGRRALLSEDEIGVPSGMRSTLG